MFYYSVCLSHSPKVTKPELCCFRRSSFSQPSPQETLCQVARIVLQNWQFRVSFCLISSTSTLFNCLIFVARWRWFMNLIFSLYKPAFCTNILGFHSYYLNYFCIQHKPKTREKCLVIKDEQMFSLPVFIVNQLLYILGKYCTVWNCVQSRSIVRLFFNKYIELAAAPLREKLYKEGIT